MRLRFSRTADYGLRAALEVALAPADELVTRHAIARAVGAPPSVLAQALSLLARADLLVAQAGPHGGYRLARPAVEISIRDVVAAVDGPEGEQRCVLREGVCSSSGPCPFHEFLVAAQGRFLEVMRVTSLADVIAGIDRLEKEGSQP